MAFDDMRCPCGGTKMSETMLCLECEAAFTGTLDSKDFHDSRLSVDFRRTAAIKLLAMARRRKTLRTQR